MVLASVTNTLQKICCIDVIHIKSLVEGVHEVRRQLNKPDFLPPCGCMHLGRPYHKMCMVRDFDTRSRYECTEACVM